LKHVAHLGVKSKMNRSDLEAKLKSANIDRVTYDLESVGKEKEYCLEQTGSGWSVYYRERGDRDFEHTFVSESKACEFMLAEILQDPTTRL